MRAQLQDTQLRSEIHRFGSVGVLRRCASVDDVSDDDVANRSMGTDSAVNSWNMLLNNVFPSPMVSNEVNEDDGVVVAKRNVALIRRECVKRQRLG